MKINRIQQIRKLLLEEHTLSIKDLCRRFDVSKNTIRRDISELEQQGLIHKVYGGIVLNGRSTAVRPKTRMPRKSSPVWLPPKSGRMTSSTSTLARRRCT